MSKEIKGKAIYSPKDNAVECHMSQALCEALANGLNR